MTSRTRAAQAPQLTSPGAGNRARRLLPLLILAAAVLLPYLNSLGNGFHWDDHHHVLENPSIRDAGNLPRFFTDPSTFSRDPGIQMYRPLLMVTYALNFAAGESRGWGYHLVNMILHLMVTLLLHRLLLLILPSPGGTGPAFAAAAIFAVHPLNSQAVNYISSRSVLLAAALLLLGLVLTLAARTPGRGLLLLPAAAAFFLALLSKSTAITVLPLLLAMYLLLPQPRTSRRDIALGLVGPLAAAAAYLWLSRAVLERSLGNPIRPPGIQLATQARVFWHYMRLVLAPFGLSVESDIVPVASPFSPAALLSVAGILLCTAAAVVISLRLKSRPGLFFILWIFITLAPTSIIPLNVVVNEHRFYLPLAGLLGMAAAWYCAAHPQPASPRVRAVLAAVLVLLAAVTVTRNRVWQDEFTLWSDAAEKCPGSPLPQVNLGLAHLRQGEREQAARRFDNALALDPGHFQALVNRGVTHLRSREYEKAAMRFRQALDQDPSRVDVAINLALAENGRGRTREAVALLQPYTDLWPNNPFLFHTLGTALLKSGQAAEGLACFQRCTEIDPRSAAGWSGTGLALVRLGRTGDAEAAFRRSVQADPDHFEGWAYLGNTLFQRGEYRKAITAYERARTIRPDDAKLNHNLALCYNRARGNGQAGPLQSP
jgi:tetratricopeptide (TPR) repeat protein